MRTIQGCALAALCVGTTSAAMADGASYEKGEALLRQVAAKYTSLQSMTADVSEEWRYSGKTNQRRGSASLQKPNLSRLDYTTPDQLILCDGIRVWALTRSDNRFSRGYADTYGYTATMSDENPVSFFFNARRLVLHPVAELVGAEMLDGVQYQLVEASLNQGRERLYVGPDLLIHRITGTHNQREFVITMTNIALNVPLDASTFTFKVPPNARARDMHTFLLLYVKVLASCAVQVFSKMKQVVPHQQAARRI